MGASKKRPPRSTGTRQSGTGQTGLPASDPRQKPFVPEDLDRTVIAIPLLKILKDEATQLESDGTLEPRAHRVVIDLNLEFPGGRDAARNWTIAAIERLATGDGGLRKTEVPNQQYLFAALTGASLRKLVQQDAARHGKSEQAHRAIYHIWPDFPIKRLVNKSLSTVKADAAHASFAALGEGIVWAVLDTGIDASHSHFKTHENLELESPLEHMDFTGAADAKKVKKKRGKTPLSIDPNGHGTHVAGIIAGESPPTPPGKKSAGVKAFVRYRDEHGEVAYQQTNVGRIVSMAPACKLVSMRVLDEDGNGEVSNIISAIARIQEINGHGRRLLIHGVNISVGNDFEPEWFACGQSPLCVEVDRLVHSGVVVVVAAGNSGYGSFRAQGDVLVSAGMSLTINDPGNAALAVTVGSTHRDMPHMYGVSYFSSKGPTGDGRLKPDLIAPGEKIISCAAGAARDRVHEEAGSACDYVEDSGTSMAAPHVSGVIAAFLSVRREFIGQPSKVKEIFMSTATDLKRERYFQGAGLVDLMRAIQSV